jgi:hypothetical protein
MRAVGRSLGIDVLLFYVYKGGWGNYILLYKGKTRGGVGKTKKYPIN